VILGDSLSAGYGLPREQALTSQLEAALRQQGLDATLPATAVSGDTTTGGLARLDWLLGDKPDLVVVALGGNDGLRGIDPAVTRDNIDRILGKLKERRVPALLAGMLAPPNLGRDYGQAFNAVFPDMARKYQVAFYPFLLEGVATHKDLLQDDGLHPNAAGVAVMVRGLLPVVTKALAPRIKAADAKPKG
jgi:acyl-CoA thioesterase-1